MNLPLLVVIGRSNCLVWVCVVSGRRHVNLRPGNVGVGRRVAGVMAWRHVAVGISEELLR